MAVSGELSTMAFPELLQWLGGNSKSGFLEVERNKIRKRLVFRQGRIVSTASNDPREMLGHFLVSRGQITEDLLRIALSQQEQTGKPLGVTLVEMGVLTGDELLRNLAAQAEEILFGLFEWEDAVFRFEDVDDPPDAPFPLDVRVEDVLLRGMQRLDEVQRIRTVFREPGIVPERTDKLPPPEVFRNRIARRIYESIDGERTVAEIVLHAHGSEYVVTKFLFELHRTGLVRVREVRRVPITHPGVARAAAPGPPAGTVVDAPAAPTPTSTREADSGPSAMPARPGPAPSATLEPADAAAFRTPVENELEHARAAMARGDFADALAVLDRLYRQNPNNEPLRRLTQEAETAFVEKAWKHYLPADKVMVLARPIEDLESEDLTPQEMFLLSRIDGTWTVKAIVQISPIREVDALRVLKRMRDAGFVDLREPD